MSHFERFGLKPSMDLDLEALETRYMELSRSLHPDRLVGKSAKLQSRALVLSSALNDAYRTLQSERLRAEHLLVHVHRGPSSETDKTTPPALLLEMMDLHESVEAAHEAGDADKLAQLAAQADEREGQALAGARAAFSAADFPTPALLKQAREHLNVAKYWVTLRSEVQAARQAL
jgi:Fe-S protein assembly co-chaperone HscB